jgi:DNA-binding response OmpR family regulator
MTAAALTTRTVLLVDDEVDIREVLALLLRRAGYCVLEAASTGEALRLVAEADLVLTDLSLPGGNGADLVGRLSAVRPGVPVLFMSGGERREGIEPGNFLAKPFSPEDLLGKVYEALGR